MEMRWLEDFLALAELESFSRAAERRHVTQSAFSRRIQALEQWVGASLVDRNTHRILLSDAGRQFLPTAEETIRRLRHGRQNARQAESIETSTLRFAATHALAVKYFPTWIGQLGSALDGTNVRLAADYMNQCEKLMLAGGTHFLLCHGHPSAPNALMSDQYRCVTLDQDVLVPVSAPIADAGHDVERRRARYQLPGKASEPLPYLSYGNGSSLGNIIAAAQADAQRGAHLSPVFSSHLAAALVTMARAGHGLAWVPLSLVWDDLDAGRLTIAGDDAWQIPVAIKLYAPFRLETPAAERLWEAVEQQIGLRQVGLLAHA